MTPKIGIALPVREQSILTPDKAAAPLLGLARQVEELGYDSVWVGDSFVTRHRLEPLTLLGAISQITHHVTIGTAALTAVLREPKNLAHSIATLDQLSNGRLTMGLGMGEPLPVNNEAYSVTMTYTERISRVDEAVTAFKKHWSNQPGTLKGTYYNLEELRHQGPPQTPQGPPVWLASNGKPKAIHRTATLYDGWMPVHITPAEYHTAWTAIQKTATDHGRSPDAITPTLYINVTTDQDAEAAQNHQNEYTTRYYQLPVTTMQNYQNYFAGTPEQLTAHLDQYVQAGAQHIILRLNTFTRLEETLTTIADTTVPVLHGKA